MIRLNTYAISGILTALTFFPLFFFIYFKGQTRVAKLFAFHCFCIAGWGIGVFLVSIEQNPTIALELWKWVYLFPLFIPVSIMHCIAEMVNLKYKKIILTACYAQALFFSVYSLNGWMNEGVLFKFNIYFIKAIFPFHLSFILWEIIVASAHCCLFWYYWKSHPEQKKQLVLLTFALIIGFCGGTMNFLPGFDFDIFPWGNFLVPVYSIMLAYAILQYQLLDISFVLRKGIIYACLIIIVSALYFFTFLLCEPFIKNFFGATNQSVIPGLFTAVFLTFVYAPIRLKIEYLVDSTFFRKYNEEIKRQNQIMELELVRSEKFKMAAEIMRNVVYEVRNPLTTIKTRSLLILQRLENKEFIEKSAKNIDQQVEKVNKLLHQLLKFSNPSSSKMEQHNVYNIISEVATIFQQDFVNNGITIKKDFPIKEQVFLRLDLVQFRQALYNVVRYSMQSMPNGGTLKLSTNLKEKFVLDINNSSNHFFYLEISSSGKQIDKEALNHIFDPFYNQTDDAGLSLSIAHRIIKEHNGIIDVTNAPNSETIFSIYIPLTDKQLKK